LAADDIIEEAVPPLVDVVAPTLQEEATLEADVANVLAVSLHAFAGIQMSNTMLLPVTIKGERMLALLDTGSIHNFLSGATMRRLGLAPDGEEHLHVTMANGDKLRCAGIARNIPITIEGETFTITCTGIDLGCFDFILGYNYLRTLDPITWDLEAKTIAFWRGGRRIQWQGMGGPEPPEPSQQAAATATAGQQPLLDHLLEHHAAIFTEPHGLPLARPYDHRIHLLPDTAPVAVRPYRYPQLQKDELERQWEAMLAQGIIRPSTSPFSAPVLLVCKADASWHFCID
jgi:hypothetical protein